ncbi:hypothetical protein I4U23_016974 [Adineta vaga]|nr:hypothetical protein I4U23_016974 [Adineta vaga]
MSKVRQRGLYPKENIMKAVTAVLNGEMTSLKASDEYHVPPGTIRTHVRNLSLGVGGGRRCYLTHKQECYLVDMIKGLEIIGVRLTKSVLKKVLGEYIKLVSNDSRFKTSFFLNLSSDFYNFSVAKKKWRSIVGNYFRKTQRKSIRKIDFPKLLNGLYQSSFTTASVSGGFRQGGVWPYNADAMKEKVVGYRSSRNHGNTNNSSAMDILSSLQNIVQSANVHTTTSIGQSITTQRTTDSIQIPSHRQHTFDDSDSDGSNDDESMNVSLQNFRLTNNDSSNSDTLDSDENFDFSINQHSNHSNSSSSTTKILKSPATAAKSIILTYSQNKTISTSSQLPKTSTRVPTERKYVTYSTGAYPNALAIVDVNNDNKPDIIVTNCDDNDVGVFLQY